VTFAFLKNYKKRFVFDLLGLATLIPISAHADVVDVLNNFLDYLTGDVGKAVAGLAIVSVGFGCFALGRIPKSYLTAVVIGIGIVFGARALLTMLTGS